MSVNILNKQTRELEPIAGVPIGKLNLLETKTNNIANDTDAYSEQKSYSVGDYVIYDNVVYKCITACTANTWENNASNFESTTLLGISNELKDALTNEFTTVSNSQTYYGMNQGNSITVRLDIPTGYTYHAFRCFKPSDWTVVLQEITAESSYVNVLARKMISGTADVTMTAEIICRKIQ